MSNYSIYTIPAAWVAALIPHVYGTSIAGSKFDNSRPRSLISSIKDDKTIDEKTKLRILRAESAQQNGFENIGLFATAVIAGNIANLPSSTLNWLSVGYVASRLVYNYIYINNETATTASARTAVFLSGIAMIMTLFIKAGNALAVSRLGRAF